MPQSDYYIAFDSSGEPYIAHAWGQRGPNQSHKYIAKIGEGPKARYFYTPEELRAFQMGGRQKAQNAVNTAKQKTANTVNKVKEKASDTAGRIRENSTLLNIGNQYRAAQRAHQNSKSSDPETAKWGKKGYDDNNTLGGKAYKAQQKAKDTLKSTSDRMKEEFRKKKDNVTDKLGVDEKKRLNDALDYRDRTMNMARSDTLVTRNLSEDAKQQGNAQKMVDKRLEEYYKTPLGKVAKAKNDAENKIDDAKRKASNKINQIKDDAKKTVEKIERERDFKNAPKSFERLIKETAKNKGISEEEVKQDLIEWTKDYYSGKDNERLDRYLEAINSVNTSKKK